MKKTIIKVTSIILAALITAAIVFTFAACGKSSSSEDEKSDTKEETKSEMNEEILGKWHTVTGNDEHEIEFKSNGIASLIDGGETVEAKYSIKSYNTVEFEIEDECLFTFEYENGILYRSEDGERDGYTYQK